MTNEIKKYCEGIDCAWCNEKEPCIYKIANDLQEQLSAKEQECEELKKQLKFEFDETLLQYSNSLEKMKTENDELRSVLEVIAGRPCFNPNDCNGHCLPNCKWNAHKLAQKALGNDF
jgi:hypothetical protein